MFISNLEVQVNPKITGKTKDANQKAAGKYNKEEHWVTKFPTLPQLARVINYPMMYRLGIKVGGNLKKDVVRVTGIGFDFDNESEDRLITIQELLKLKDQIVLNNCNWKIGDYAIVHETLSSSTNLQKFRIIYAYDKPINIEMHERIYNYLKVKHPIFNKSDPACYDAGRGFYGGKNATVGDSPIPINVEQLYKVITELEDAIAPIQPAKQQTKTVKSTKNNYKEKYLISELKREYGVDYIEEIPPQKLFWLYDHEFMKTADPDKDIKLKYHGRNPFSESNRSGQSFVISYIVDEDGSEKLPIWYDRSNSESSETLNKNGSNYFEYVKKLLNYTEFNEAWISVCEHFGINPRTYKERLQIPTDFADVIESDFRKYDIMKFKIELDNYIRKTVIKLDTSDETQLYLYKLGNINRWSTKQNVSTIFTDSVVPGALKPYLMSIYEPIGEPKDDTELRAIIDQLVVENAFISNIKKMFSEMLDKVNKININSIDPYHDEYIPFLNGFYDVENRKFIKDLPNDIQALNLNSYQFPYNPNVEECEQDFIHFKRILETSYNNSETRCDRLTFELWVILSVLRVAYKTKNIVGLMGTAGTGKTSNAEILLKLCDAFGSMGLEEHFQSGEKFGTSHYVDKENIIINEYKGSSDSTRLKSISGTGAQQGVLVEKKGLQAVTYFVRWSFTFISEGIPYQKVNDGGMERRMIYIDHSEVDKFSPSDPRNKLRNQFIKKLDKKDGEFGGNFHTNYYFRFSKTVANIVSHIVRNFTPDDVLEQWELHVNSEAYRDRSRKVVNENNPVNDFIETHLLITNNEDDYITTNQLSNLVEGYLKQYPGNRKPFLYASNKHKSQLLDYIESFNWQLRRSSKQGGSDRVRVNGDRVRVHRGLKIRETGSDNLLNIAGLINLNNH